MNKYFLLILGVLLFAATSFASIEMLYPVESSLETGSSIQAGFVSPGQVFELIFSDNSGHGFEWNRMEFDESLPLGWTVISTEMTDTSLIAKISVPKNTSPNFYILKAFFSNTKEPSVKESVNVRVVVKQNLLDVSFARQTKENFSVVGGEVSYKVIVSNSSIAPHNVKITSSLPSNWFGEKELVAKPNKVIEEDLVVTPHVYGKNSFSFQAENNGVVLKSFSSELNIRPTLKGKFSSAFSGFPFFTFSLLPFQLADSFLALILPS